MGEKQKLNRTGNRAYLDALGKQTRDDLPLDWLDFRKNLEKRGNSLFFGASSRSTNFCTDNSGLYFDQERLREVRAGKKLAEIVRRMDALYSLNASKNRINLAQKEDWVVLFIRRKYLSLRERLINSLDRSTGRFSPAKIWNLSMVGAVIFGMFTMTMIYHYLGQNVSAKMEESNTVSIEASPRVLGARDNINDDIDTEYISRVLEDVESGEKMKQKDFEKEIMTLVSGYPIEKMVPEIVKKDRIVAAFLIAIAKKESNWGKRVPVLNGEDCLNYWGYRGIRDKMGTGGHTCFNSTKDAVDTVAKRIEYLVSETKRDTPDKMVVWKCGYDCSWDNKNAVRKWISDVDLYFQKLNKE